MATWTTPKTNWTTNDGIGDTDLNRIEENTEYLYDQNDNVAGHLRNYVSGFTVNANSGSEGVYEIRVSGGIWSDSNGNYVDWGGAEMVKTLSATAWTAGASGQARIDSATYTTNGWYWVFALYNPSTNAHDFAVDDDITGANLGPAATAGYTLSRRVCAVLTTTHIAVAGIMPMHYESYLKTIEYAGIATSRSVSTALSANLSTPVTLTLPGGNDMVPWVSGNPYEDRGTLELEVVVSTSTRVTIWQSGRFGTTHYSGVGPRRYYASSSDIHDFKIAGDGGTIRMESTNAATVTVIMKSMTYNTDDLV
jgi:hypothetical protein|tara:strand:+ start:144 stop:1067 length:924 start_codon:yes stop_codon:yes gene_type:complete